VPADELAGVEDATIQLKNGKTARVTMHVLEGSKEDIEKQLRSSTEAFFDFYPEI
jgi:acyl carrier protein phosphodiesterase